MLEVRAVDEITALLGRGKVLTDEEVLEKYSTDMGGFRRRPSAVVVAENVEDVSRLLKFCNERKIPLTAWGAGSSLTGAVVSDSIILDLSKLDRILRIDTVNYYVHVEAGVVLERLNRELERHGFFFPPDPASSFICTVGGAVAEGSGGLRCVKYGTVKDWVLALKVVLADGSVAIFGEPLPKNRAGYNLVQLLVGSEGTLGIIVEAWLKIAPIPDVSIKRVYAVFDSWADAGNAILEIRRTRLVPRMLEFFDSVGLEAANRMHGENLPIGEAMLLIDVEEYRGNETSNLLSILKRNNARIVKIAESEEEAEKLLQIRATIYMALNAISKARVIEDVCVPIDRIVEYLLKVKEISKKYGVVVSMNGHAGDGNIHPSVLYDPDDPDEVKRVEKVLQELIRYSTEIGGTITGEHGVGLQKMRDLAMQLESHNGPQVLDLMRRLKKLFDPNNILNPGKYVDMT